MSTVEFQEDTFYTNTQQHKTSKQSKVINFLIQNGIIKDQKSGAKLLLIISLILILTTSYILVRLNTSKSTVYNIPQFIVDSLPAEAQNKINDSKK